MTEHSDRKCKLVAVDIPYVGISKNKIETSDQQDRGRPVQALISKWKKGMQKYKHLTTFFYKKFTDKSIIWPSCELKKENISSVLCNFITSLLLRKEKSSWYHRPICMITFLCSLKTRQCITFKIIGLAVHRFQYWGHTFHSMRVITLCCSLWIRLNSNLLYFIRIKQRSWISREKLILSRLTLLLVLQKYVLRIETKKKITKWSIGSIICMRDPVKKYEMHLLFIVLQSNFLRFFVKFRKLMNFLVSNLLDKFKKKKKPWVAKLGIKNWISCENIISIFLRILIKEKLFESFASFSSNQPWKCKL